MQLQWGRDPRAADSPIKMYPRYTFWQLQWGRDPRAADSKGTPAMGVGWRSASMGPRPKGRG